MAHEHHAADRFGPVAHGIDSSRHITLYVQVANFLRHQVLSGAWEPGLRLPSFEVLAEQMKVARITVRQAVNVLVQEGLLTSSRGRGTFVQAAPASAASPLNAAAVDALSPEQSDLRIQLLYKGAAKAPPPEFVGGWKLFGAYTELTKIHLHRDQPFAMIRIFVANEALRTLPKKSYETRKLLRLLMQQAGPLADTLHQTMTVEPADFILSEHLKYAFGSPVAKIMRHAVSTDGRLAYAGLSWYRGDLFMMHMSLPRSIVLANPAELIAPLSRTA